MYIVGTLKKKKCTSMLEVAFREGSLLKHSTLLYGFEVLSHATIIHAILFLSPIIIFSYLKGKMTKKY